MSTIITVDAILFDMDGTLIDSTPGVIAAWKTWADKYNLGDSTEIAHNAHGRRLQDTLKDYCNITDEERLSEEVNCFEEEVIRGGPVPLPGSIGLVSMLSSHAKCNRKWTIVTSASSKFAQQALEQSGIPIPALGFISANDVQEGKPRPAPYLAGASLCGVDPKKCLVVEDAVSGLIAGRTAGARTLAVCTSTKRSTLIECGNPDFIVADLTKVSLDFVDDMIQVSMDQSQYLSLA